MNYYYRAVDDRHRLYSLSGTKVADLSRYEIGQWCLHSGHTYRDYQGNEYTGDELIAHINGPIDKGFPVAISKRERGRSVD